MIRWQDLSDAERHVLDVAVEDNTLLFELALPVTHTGFVLIVTAGQHATH